MPLVNVMVNGKAYTLGCGEGEEPHLKELAALVDVKVREAQSMVGAQASDTKLLLTAALLLADEHHDALAKLDNTAAAAGSLMGERDQLSGKAEAAEAVAADALEAAAARIERSLAALAGAGGRA
jgi:cell division protein ZapA